MLNIHPIRCGWGIAFLVENPEGLFLVDSGSPGNHRLVLAKMAQLRRRDLRMIWITHAHYDHYGSAQALRQVTGAKIGVHPADVAIMRHGQSPLGTPRKYGIIYIFAQHILQRLRPLANTAPDFVLSHGETLENFGLDAKVLHTPGHTPGHTCLLLPNGIAFAGDLLGSFPKPGVQRLLATDWDSLSTSLAELKSAHPKWVFTGHLLKPVSGSVLQAIERNKK